MKQKKTKWLIIGIVIAVLLIGAGVAIGVYFYNQNQTEETGKKKKEEKEEEVDLELAMMLASYTATDPEADTDEDGILDGEEEQLGLNKFSADTDGDGLEDTYERTESMTDPLLWDTDEDGLSDGEEIMAGLNPKEKRSDGENKDIDRLFTREFALEGGSLSIEGAANVYNLYTGIESESNLSDLTGVYGEVHEFYLEGKKFKNATLTLTYDEKQVRNQGFTPENLRICQVTDQLELVPVDCINDGNGTVTAELEHFSMWALADIGVVEAAKILTPRPKVALLIDNSGSMYDIEGSDANDPEMKRLDMAKQIVEDLSDSCDFQVSKFTAAHFNLTSEWTSDEATLYAAIDGINENENFNGTYIANAVIETTKRFEKESGGEKRYIILLTDGATTESGIFCYNVVDASNYARDKGITVITIGLGSKVDINYLMTLSQNTGGFYVYANVADALESVSDRISSGMNHNYVDEDGDGEFDYVSVADSGFDVKRDGFSFKNYHFFDGKKVINGQCYGMNLFAQLYYLGKVPIQRGEEKGTDFKGVPYNFSVVPGYENEKKTLDNKVPLYDKYDFTRFNSFNKSTGKHTLDKTHLVMTDVWKRYIDQYPLFVLKEIKNEKGDLWKNIKFKTADMLALTFDDVDPDTLTEAKDRELYELLRALNNFQACQDTDVMETIQFKWGYKDASVTPAKKMERFNSVVEKLEAGIPLIMGSYKHVANTIRIERSLSNSLEYRFFVYDSNCPGEEKVVTMKREIAIISSENGGETRAWDYVFYDTDGVFGSPGERIDLIEFYYWKEISI